MVVAERQVGSRASTLLHRAPDFAGAMNAEAGSERQGVSGVKTRPTEMKHLDQKKPPTLRREVSKNGCSGWMELRTR